MVYGRYKGIRNAAWQTLIDFNVTQLPVHVMRIAKTAGIRVLKNEQVQMLSDNQCGLSILTDAQWFVIYDETMSVTRKRFTIAHELGHIFLGHALKEGFHARQFEGAHPEDEQEANMYAIRLLVPACVLWGLNLHTPEEIANACAISLSSAQWRAKRMEELYRRNRFLTAPLERKVYQQFESFITEHKREGDSGK